LEEDLDQCRSGGSYTTLVTLEAPEDPVVVFSYPMEEYCVLTPETIAPILDPDFEEGGSFASTPGHALDPDTGEIDLAGSEPGTYEITYSVDADLEECIGAGSYTVALVITAPVDPVVGFSYPME